MICTIRKWGNQYIAIFPYELGTNSPVTCLSYMTVGQHSACDPLALVSVTKYIGHDVFRPDGELKRFISELESIYGKLDIKLRTPKDAYNVRCEKLREIEQ